MRILFCGLFFLPLSALAEVVTVDFVRVLNDHHEEAVYYYENNWKQHRIKALDRGYISSYKLLVKTSDDGQTDILLITGYASDSQYEAREDNFAVVMRESRRDGPALLNDKTPGEFRDVVDGGVFTADP
jgi:hypothetical protein